MSDKLYSPIIYDPKSKIYYKQELNTHVGIVLNAQQQFVNKLIKQRDDYKTQRDTLIDDLSWYKAKVSRLEQKNQVYLDRVDCSSEKYRKSNIKISRLERENKDLRIQSNTYFDEWQEAEKQRSEFITMLNESNNLLSEISQHIGNKPSSSTYKYFREKLNGIGIKEVE